ncbi:EGF-like repeat and discoidin I-like domain-containing protein 3 [Dendronephthya gigantea]|uniref:EGF-like repeat and discoidin I-like domain-containing protein 3 n=1 Tax=Dendronephthya gigantea TaxID=151771 RepID=UPI001069AB56|nr:EGF-like repeat and discoidin I-like domain-containing protein 3 [Dendronephthya gigantea]
MRLIGHTLRFFTALITLLISLENTVASVNFCYDSSFEGFRLNTAIHSTALVYDWVDCAGECLKEPCCRSINFKKEFISENSRNYTCEMLHNVITVPSKHLLEPNSSYDYIFFHNPRKKFNISCLDQKACKMALGMENGNINDNQITASNEHNINHRAANGRLNFTPRDGRTGAWSSGKQNLNQWLQVDFQRSTLVTAISTQGRSDKDQFVKNYTVSFSQDGHNFHDYTQKGANKEFDGNSDRNSIVQNPLIPPISARFIRIHPTSSFGHMSMRVEFYGCPAT